MGIQINVRDEEMVVQTFCFSADCDFMTRKLTVLIANLDPELSTVTEQTIEEAMDDLEPGEGEAYDNAVEEFRSRLQEHVDKGYVIHKMQPSDKMQPTDEQISSAMESAINELGDL